MLRTSPNRNEPRRRNSSPALARGRCLGREGYAALAAVSGSRRTFERQRIRPEEVLVPTFCLLCGVRVAENERHSCRSSACSLTGSGRVGVAPGPEGRTSPPAALAPHAAGALAYSAGLITGIVFLVLEPYRRERCVRFHAWQSIWFSLAWIALWIPWNMVTSVLAGTAIMAPGLATGSGRAFPALLIALINRLLGLSGFLFWAFLVFKAYGGEQFRIPLLGKLAASQAARPVA
jgi:uncharacterized membrane protein